MNQYIIKIESEQGEILVFEVLAIESNIIRIRIINGNRNLSGLSSIDVIEKYRPNITKEFFDLVKLQKG